MKTSEAHSIWRVATPVLPPLRHDVQFYGDDAYLCSEVGRFLAEGLRAQQAIVVIATAAHRRALEAEFRVQGFDLDTLHPLQVTWLDAHETLSAFMEGPRPNPALFLATVGNVLQRAMSYRPRGMVLAYGEMVDVLWGEGKCDGALDVEELWNALGRKYRFSLRCAYSRNNLITHAREDAVERICAQHSDVLPSPTQ